MSHFKTWVIVAPRQGADPDWAADTDGIEGRVDQLLGPYNADIQVERYDRDAVEDDALDSFLDYYKEQVQVGDMSDARRALIAAALTATERADRLRRLYAAVGFDWSDGNWEERDGAWVETSTYSPDAKWDWYQIGGRYRDSLVTRGGEQVNAVRVRDLDLGSMADLRRRQAVEAMDAFDAGTTAAHYGGDEGTARFMLEFPVGMTRDEWIAMRTMPAPFAVVDEHGRWHEEAKAGPFGTKYDSNTSWDEEFAAVMGTANPDAVVVVVDCHI
jgi:hypothetical protein